MSQKPKEEAHAPTPEAQAFLELARKIVRVPKEEVQEAEKARRAKALKPKSAS